MPNNSSLVFIAAGVVIAAALIAVVADGGRGEAPVAPEVPVSEGDAAPSQEPAATAPSAPESATAPGQGERAQGKPVQTAATSPEAASNAKNPDAVIGAELRRKVEGLKSLAAAGGINQDNARENALILFEWANKLSLQGILIPVELPSMAGIATQPGPMTESLIPGIAQLVEEMAIREDSPGDFGTLEADNAGPFPVGSFQTIRQTYTVGDRPISVGGGFTIGRHFMSNQGQYQTTDPSADNYVSITSSDESVSFTVGARGVFGMFGGFRSLAPQLFFEVAEGTLDPGETVTITIGDTSGGGRGFQVQTHANDAFPLPVYVDFDGAGRTFSLPNIHYSVIGGAPVRVQGFAPSTLETGEAFELSVRAEDVYRNRATGTVPALDVLVNGEVVRTLPESEEAIRVIDDLSLDAPGVYHITFASEDGTFTGASNPIWVQREHDLNIYWGETHAHSGFAEGQGSPDYFYTFARDDARLDFVGMSEHDHWLDDREWEIMRDAVDRYHEDGRFITYLGYEWTVQTTWGGHHNVFFRDTEGRSRVGKQYAPVLSALYRGLRAENDTEDVLIIPHAHQAGEYRLNDAQMETLIEIMSLHGTFEWFGRAYVDAGHEVGFIAASDDHLSHPGYSVVLSQGLSNRAGLAAVLAPEKSRDAIFDAMKDRSAYATTGERIILDMDVAGGRMGTRIPYTADRTIDVTAIGTAPIESITIIKNGEEVFQSDFVAAADQSTGRYQLTFYSDTDPGYRENARGWRDWRGTLRVNGARLVGVEPPGLPNPHNEYARLSESDSNVVDFAVRTRGHSRSFILELADVSPDASITIATRPATEYGTPFVLPQTQLHAYPALETTLEIAERAAQQVPGAVMDDSIELKAVRDEAPLTQTLSWTDGGTARPGDYYFVRVQQTDGALAWSSPVWVGGLSPTEQ